MQIWMSVLLANIPVRGEVDVKTLMAHINASLGVRRVRNSALTDSAGVSVLIKLLCFFRG